MMADVTAVTLTRGALRAGWLPEGRAPTASRATRGGRGDRSPTPPGPRLNASEGVGVGLHLRRHRVPVQLGGVGPGHAAHVLRWKVSDLGVDHRLGVGPG